MRPNPTAVLVAAVASFLGVLGVMLTLILTGHHDDVTTVAGLASPLVAGLFVAAKVDSVTVGQNTRLDEHSKALATITHQTNGVLDGRIRDGVLEALTVLHAAETVPAALAAPPTYVPVPLLVPTSGEAAATFPEVTPGPTVTA